MKIVKKAFWILVLIGSISFVSCGDDSSDSNNDDGTPSKYYVEFSGEGYGPIKWTAGFSDYGDGVPAGSNELGAAISNFIALDEPIATSSFSKNSINYVYVCTSKIELGTYDTLFASIFMRLKDSPDGDNQFGLAAQSVTYTEVTDDYVKGTFTGKTPSNVEITGSFVFKKAPADSWPFGWPLP